MLVVRGGEYFAGFDMEDGLAMFGVMSALHTRSRDRDAVTYDERRGELQTGQLDFLDQAGKRIIELSSALLAVLFGVLAFGDKFPPAYLAAPALKALLIGALVLYMAAICLAAWAIHPRSYDYYPSNVTAAREELARMVRFKAGWVKAGGAAFVLASLFLTGAAVMLVWGAG
jgi:hypothetical protein